MIQKAQMKLMGKNGFPCVPAVPLLKKCGNDTAAVTEMHIHCKNYP